KHCLVDYIEQYDIPAPLTFRPRSYDEALALRDRLPYPVLLKPRGEAGGRGIRCAHNPKELESALSQQKPIPLIQEYIEGDDLVLNVLCLHGEPLAVSAYRVLRKYPLPFGPPIACRTIKDDALEHLGIKFLRKLRYHGFANLDFRMDRRDGQPKLLEFNPRLSETVEISVRSGVNFPLMLYKLALGEQVAPCFAYDVGLEFRWLLYGEILHLMSTRDKGKTIRNLLKTRRFSTNVSLRDPLPHLVEGAIIVVRGFSGLLGHRKPIP
ncbi:MAG: ATP-grasp domain-containing protein, partial [Candidatus Aminicenantes bacterium]|nr:ATP-grasp domain-containing protein [Candidatus Aminicenantes bacterium]